MYIVLGIIFVLVGLVMLLKPQIIFQLTESWKHDYPTEPSDSYVFSTKIGGCIVGLIGLASIIFFVFA